MNFRRIVAATAASVIVLGTLTVGLAAPASAEPALTIPTCKNMLNDPANYFDDFAAINGDSAVAYRPTPRLFGSDVPRLKTFLRDWNATNCSWHLNKGGVTHNFTISEVHMNSFSDRVLRRWYANHGIVGTDAEPTLGGFAYGVNSNEYDVLMHGRVWIAITERGTSVEGYTMQTATSTIVDLNPWILSGTE